MTKRSPSVKNSLPTLDEVFEILPTSSALKLVIRKSAWGGREAILGWRHHLVPPACGQKTGHFDHKLGVALEVMDLKIPAHVVKHLFKEDCLQALLLIQDLDNCSQGAALVLDSDPLQAAGKAVRGGRPRHLQHHRRPFPLSQSEGEGPPRGAI